MTNKQKEVLNFISVYIKANLRVPTFKEMKEYVGFKSNNAISGTIDKLIEQGYLKKENQQLKVTNKMRYEKGLFFVDMSKEISSCPNCQMKDSVVIKESKNLWCFNCNWEAEINVINKGVNPNFRS